MSILATRRVRAAARRLVSWERVNGVAPGHLPLVFDLIDSLPAGVQVARARTSGGWLFVHLAVAADVSVQARRHAQERVRAASERSAHVCQVCGHRGEFYEDDAREAVLCPVHTALARATHRFRRPGGV